MRRRGSRRDRRPTKRAADAIDRSTRLNVMRTFMLVLCAVGAFAETRTLTLRQALDLALQQNPDLVIARLDQDRARYQVAIARDPFIPKVFAGSGAAYTTGFPASVDGAAPSIFQT